MSCQSLLAHQKEEASPRIFPLRAMHFCLRRAYKLPNKHKLFVAVYIREDVRKLRLVSPRLQDEPKMTKRPFTRHWARWPDVRMVRCLEGLMFKWSDGQRSKLVRCPDDQMSGWSNIRMVRCLDGQMSGWSDVRMVRCTDGQMSRWPEDQMV